MLGDIPGGGQSGGEGEGPEIKEEFVEGSVKIRPEAAVEFVPARDGCDECWKRDCEEAEGEAVGFSMI